MMIEINLTKSCLFLLNIVGISPLVHNKWSIGRAFLALSLLMGIMCFNIWIIAKAWNGVITFIYYSAAFMSFCQAFLKASVLIWKRKDFKNMLTNMKYFWPTEKYGKQVSSKFKNNLKLMLKVLYMYKALGVSAVISFSAASAKLDFFYANPYPKNSTLFKVIWAYDTVTVFIDFCVILGFDSLYAALITHVCTDLDILEHGLANINYENNDSAEEFASLIQHHNFILSFIRDLDQVYSPFLLAQLLITFGSMVPNIFLVMGYENKIGDLSQYLMYSACAVVQIFIFCFAGDKVSSKAEGLGTSIYFSEWYTKSGAKFQKDLVLIMLRSQKEEEIKIGGITPLNMETFASILKKAMSFMAVLQAMYTSDK